MLTKGMEIIKLLNQAMDIGTLKQLNFCIEGRCI